jgi:hypothetical protein
MRAVLANIVVCTQRKCLQIFDTDYWYRKDLARYTFGQDVWIRAKMSISQQLAHDKADSNPEKEKLLDDLLPKTYHEHKLVFEKEASECFPESRPWDHAIDLKSDFILKDCKVYPLTLAEQMKLDKFLEENL